VKSFPFNGNLFNSFSIQWNNWVAAYEKYVAEGVSPLLEIRFDTAFLQVNN